MDYEKAKQYASQHHETNDCTVKAIAIACDVPYAVAHKALKIQGRLNRKGAYRHQQVKAIQSLGFKAISVPFTASTVTSLKFEPAVAKGYYMAFIKRHVLAVVDGKVEDWSDGRRHRLQEIIKVMPAVSRTERAKMKAAVMAQ